MKLKSLLFVFTGLIVGTLLTFSSGCSRPTGNEKLADQDKESAKKPTTDAPAGMVRMSFTHKIESPGEIHADEETRIFARITGHIKKIHKDVGDRVTETTVLAELSVPELVEDEEQKRALVNLAKAERERATKLHKAAEASVDVAEARRLEAVAARARAVADRDRADSQYARLKENAAVIAAESIAEAKRSAEAARAALAEVDARIKAAEASRREFEAKRDTAFAEIAVVQAQVKVAEAAARSMAEMLKYAQLKAPFKGVVVQRSAFLGDLVHSSTPGSKGAPAFVVARIDPVRVHVDVPENDAVLIDEGKTEALVRVQALKGEVFTGVIKRSSWRLDPKGRILSVQIDVANSEGKLRPGMYAQTTITVVHKDVWAVPAAALVAKDDQTYLFVEEAGKVRRLAVLTGLRDSRFVEILRTEKKMPPGSERTWQAPSGEEKVITRHIAKLVDGQSIESGSASDK